LKEKETKLAKNRENTRLADSNIIYGLLEIVDPFYFNVVSSGLFDNILMLQI